MGLKRNVKKLFFLYLTFFSSRKILFQEKLFKMVLINIFRQKVKSVIFIKTYQQFGKKKF